MPKGYRNNGEEENGRTTVPRETRKPFSNSETISQRLDSIAIGIIKLEKKDDELQKQIDDLFKGIEEIRNFVKSTQKDVSDLDARVDELENRKTTSVAKKPAKSTATKSTTSRGTTTKSTAPKSATPKSATPKNESTPAVTKAAPVEEPKPQVVVNKPVSAPSEAIRYYDRFYAYHSPLDDDGVISYDRDFDYVSQVAGNSYKMVWGWCNDHGEFIDELSPIEAEVYVRNKQIKGLTLDKAKKYSLN